MVVCWSEPADSEGAGDDASSDMGNRICWLLFKRCDIVENDSTTSTSIHMPQLCRVAFKSERRPGVAGAGNRNFFRARQTDAFPTVHACDPPPTSRLVPLASLSTPCIPTPDWSFSYLLPAGQAHLLSTNLFAALQVI